MMGQKNYIVIPGKNQFYTFGCKNIKRCSAKGCTEDAISTEKSSRTCSACELYTDLKNQKYKYKETPRFLLS